MTIDFEKDQQDAMKKTDGVQSLADQVERFEAMQQQLEIQEESNKRKEKTNPTYIRRGYTYHDV